MVSESMPRDGVRPHLKLPHPPPPPLAKNEKENGTIYLGFLPPTYYDRLTGYASTSFFNLDKKGERIEDSVKTEKIKDYQTLFERSSSDTLRSTRKIFPNKKYEKNKKEVHFISSQAPRHQSSYVQPAPSIRYLHHRVCPQLTLPVLCILPWWSITPTIATSRISTVPLANHQQQYPLQKSSSKS